MTATFLLPLAMGVATGTGGNLATEAFGVVAMVAMTPLITIQLLGLITTVKSRVTVPVTAVEEEVIVDADDL
jgi:hypothetical protein